MTDEEKKGQLKVDNRYVDPFLLEPEKNYKPMFPTKTLVDTDLKPDPSFFQLMGANFRRETVLGGWVYGANDYGINFDEANSFNFVEHIPEDLTGYPDAFASCTNTDQIDRRAKQLREELGDRAMMAQSPWKAFAAGVPIQITAFENLALPGGQIYRYASQTKNIMKSATSAAIAGFASGAIQENVLQSRQLSREASESALNPFVSALFSGAIGGVSGKFATKHYGRFKQDIVDEMTDTPKKMSENGTLSDNDIAQMPEMVKKMMPVTPMNRLLTSPFETAKELGSIFYEHNWNLVKNYEGGTQGRSIETGIKVDRREISAAMLDYQDVYFQSRGIGKGPFRGTRDSISGVGQSLDEFNLEVTRVILEGVESNDPHIKQGADILQNRVFNPLKDRAVAAGLLPEDVKVKNAADYFMTVYNKQRIIEEGGSAAPIGRDGMQSGTFVEKVYNSFVDTNQKIKRYRQSSKYKKLNKQIKTLKEEIKISDKNIKKELRAEVARIEAEIVEGLDPDMVNSKGRLRSAQSEPVIEANARQTVDAIIGHKDGALLNPVLDMIGGAGGRPLKERKLMINQSEMMPWLVNDPMKIADMYARAMAPAVNMAEAAQRAGFKSVPEWRAGLEKQLKEELREATKGKTGKDASNLNKKFESNIKDIKASMDLLQGVYGDGPNVLSNRAAQFYRNFLTWNAIRLLGFMTITSFADMGIQVFRNGMWKTLHHGIIPVLKDIKESGITNMDLRAIGYGIETELGTRIKAFAEHDGLQSDPGIFQKSFDMLSQKFGNATLMNQWNSFNQKIAGHTSINRTLDAAAKVVEGKKLSGKEKTRIAQLGISEAELKIIGQKTAGMIDEKTGVRFADWTNWEIGNAAEANALRAFKESVAKEIDSIVIIPGLGDKPLIGHTPLGKALFQFKTFLMSSTNKVLLSGIQKYDDVNTWTGLSAMLSLGALSYVTTMAIRGDEVDWSFQNMATEAIDRSGVLGIVMEVYNIGNKSGLVPGVGVTRYKSRDILGSLTGPAGGLLSEIATVLNHFNGAATGQQQLTTKDVEKMMRLAPMQNLFYLYRLNKALARKAAINLGFEEVD